MPDDANRRYVARLSRAPDDIAAAQALRGLSFADASQIAHDHDGFDDICTHILIEESATDRLVCCFRILPLRAGSEIARSYAAQFYDLSVLSRFAGPMVEMGRFCVHPDCGDPDILRVAWAAMTRHVDENGVELLFGCSSFVGTDEAAYLDAFATLKDRYLAPRGWQPRIKAETVFDYARALRERTPDRRLAMLQMPPLLRTYLAMGGWVSDHAVVDRQMNTLHVFTGVEIAAIPAVRKRLLRAAAG